jgi:nucleotide-binding universal stress UspA family protein
MSNIILVPLDGSSLADSAVPHAAEFARGIGAVLRVMRVHLPMPSLTLDASPVIVPDPRIEAEIVMTKRAWLEAKEKEIRASSGLTVTSEFRVGSPGEAIVTAADDCDARMIVCTTHGSGGWAPQWFGSVTDYVIRHTLKPVLAMSARGASCPTKPASILVLLDGSERAESILPDVQQAAEAFGARVELFRVVPPWFGDVEGVVVPQFDRFGIDAYASEAKRELDAIADEFRAKGITVTATVDVRDGVTRTILEHIEATNPDLVALATHGRGIARLVVGSVADKVLRAGARPVLCLRPHRTAAGEAIAFSDSRTAGAATLTPA